MEVLVSPLAVATKRKTIAGNPFAASVMDALRLRLRDGVLSRPVAKMMDYEDQSATREFAEAVLGGDAPVTLHAQVLSDLYSSLPHKLHLAFVSRFQKPSTLTYLCGRATVSKLIKNSRLDAIASYNGARALIMRE
eukprot:5123261-Amphidinium_carterae.1